MTNQNPIADPTPLDLKFALRWHDDWIDAWNSHDPQEVAKLVCEDFVLDTPTTRNTGWSVQGPQGLKQYVEYVLRAYPDLMWERLLPPMLCVNEARAGFYWRGWGTFSGILTPPGIPGTGRPFDFEGVEVFDFHAGRACRGRVAYDLFGMMRQSGALSKKSQA